MSTYKDAKQWAQVFAKRIEDKSVTERMAFRIMTLEYRNDMRRNLSGTTSSAQLRRDGHPYGRTTPGDGVSRMRGSQRRMANGKYRRYPLAPINKQSGRLLAGLKIRPYTDTVAKLGFDVFSDAPHNKYILHPLGTKRMVGRDMLTGHALGRQVPGLLERLYRAKQREIRLRYAKKSA